jgi:hypothetical protein
VFILVNAAMSALQPCKVRGTANLPIAFSTAVLLSLLWINIDMAVFGKVFGEHRFNGQVLLAAVDAVTEFVGASHC